MSLLQSGCPIYQFKPKINHENDLLLPATLFGVQLPGSLSSLDVRVPTYVTPSQMQDHLRQYRISTQRGLGIVHGLTTVDFRVSFSNMLQQWRQISSSGSSPVWQFQGGDVYLEIWLKVLILQGDRPVPSDPYSIQIFSVIMSHELEHVADEIDIVSNWMQSVVYQDQMVRRYLSDAQPVDDRMFRNWFLKDGFNDWLKNGIWALEHNRRAASRDSPANYNALQRQIEALRARQINSH